MFRGNETRNLLQDRGSERAFRYVLVNHLRLFAVEVELSIEILASILLLLLRSHQLLNHLFSLLLLASAGLIGLEQVVDVSDGDLLDVSQNGQVALGQTILSAFHCALQLGQQRLDGSFGGSKEVAAITECAFLEILDPLLDGLDGLLDLHSTVAATSARRAERDGIRARVRLSAPATGAVRA